MNSETTITKESLWHIDNYVLIRNYYDRTASRIAARCIRKGNIAIEDYPHYSYILDVLEELCETGDYLVAHKEIHDFINKKIAGGIEALEKNLSIYKIELDRNASTDMEIKNNKKIAEEQAAFAGFTNQSVAPTSGAGDNIDDVVSKLVQQHENATKMKENKND